LAALRGNATERARWPRDRRLTYVRVRLSGIYALVDRELVSDPLKFVVSVLAAGVRLVQYRAKGGVDRELVRRLRVRTRQAGAVLIVNDDRAAALDADGLHVGQEDVAALDASALRAQLRGLILGISCATPEEAARAAALGADYLGVGPFARTATKADAGPPIGEAGLRRVTEATKLPVAAIGGIELSNLEAVVRGGAAMAAVAGAISHGADPFVEARALVLRWAALR
jgi:thiamine-phosphate pyrophosphorylase